MKELITLTLILILFGGCKKDATSQVSSCHTFNVSKKFIVKENRANITYDDFYETSDTIEPNIIISKVFNETINNSEIANRISLFSSDYNNKLIVSAINKNTLKRTYFDLVLYSVTEKPCE